jgi:hypothetical protein
MRCPDIRTWKSGTLNFGVLQESKFGTHKLELNLNISRISLKPACSMNEYQNQSFKRVSTESQTIITLAELSFGGIDGNWVVF